jgi:hypothetical protein
MATSATAKAVFHRSLFKLSWFKRDAHNKNGVFRPSALLDGAALVSLKLQVFTRLHLTFTPDLGSRRERCIACCKIDHRDWTFLGFHDDPTDSGFDFTGFGHAELNSTEGMILIKDFRRYETVLTRLLCGSSNFSTVMIVYGKESIAMEYFQSYVDHGTLPLLFKNAGDPYVFEFVSRSDDHLTLELEMLVSRVAKRAGDSDEAEVWAVVPPSWDASLSDD